MIRSVATINKDDILHHLNITEFYQELIPSLKINGKIEVMGICPFHEDDSPSLSINIKSGLYNCFACNEGGDIFAFYQKLKQVNFHTALKEIAKMQGIDTTPITPKVTATFYYRNTNNEIVYRKQRIEPGKNGKSKEFYFHHQKNGQWIPGRGHTPLLYNLPKLSQVTDIFIVEGEAHCDFLDQWGIVGTTLDTGANARPGNYDLSALKGKNVVILPDNDEPGRAYAANIAHTLYGKALQIKIVELPGLKEKGDIIDWIKIHGNNKQKLMSIIHETPERSLGEISDGKNLVKPSSNHTMLWENLQLSYTAQNRPHANMDNVVRILSRYQPFHNLLWYDDFHQKFFTRWQSDTAREWTDSDDLMLTQYIQRDLGIPNMTDLVVHKGCIRYGSDLARNEPLDWMETLKWDGVERIEQMFSDVYGANDDPYVRAVSQNFWIAMAARIYKPGCKYDNMVVLEGGQGKFKSTSLSIIGGKWFTEVNESVQHKDFYLALQGKLLIEISELDAFGKAETSKIKSVVSNPVDRYRTPYERSAQDHRRQCVFVGTTNENHYLRDNSGGRRFWPVKTRQIRLDIIKENRDQYFAEAVAKYKQGVSWWEVPEQALAEQELRRQGDEWESIIAEYILHKDEVTVTDILRDALKIEPAMQGKPEQMRVSHALKYLKWERHRTSRYGVSVSVWMPEGE